MEPVPLKPERAVGILDEAAALLRTVPVQPGSLAVRHDPGVPDPVCNAGLLARTLAGLAAEILAASGRAGDARLCLRASVPVQLGAGLGSEPVADQDDPDRDATGWTVRPLLTPRRGPHILFELRVDGPPLADDVLSMLVDPLLFARACYRRGQSEREEGASWPAALLTARLHDGGLSLLTHPVEGTAVRLHIPAVPPPLRTARAATPQPENAPPQQPQQPQQAAPLLPGRCRVRRRAVPRRPARFWSSMPTRRPETGSRPGWNGRDSRCRSATTFAMRWTSSPTSRASSMRWSSVRG